MGTLRRNLVYCPGAVYHVVGRGVRRERVFYDRANTGRTRGWCRKRATGTGCR